ncbi:MAG TPA: hypothetical protein PKZ53_26630, partial [Acidobacteriota bacterium]|nr:hypothetical protein [Acidobacteriota bacterium]
MITDLFNPWHGWRHRDWEDEFEVSREQLPVITQEHIVNIYEPGKSWLGFWFPLRNKSITDTSELSEGWIHESFPGDNPRFFQELVCELQELAPSLVFLRNLKQLAMLNRTSECSDSLLLKFSLQSERIPAPDVQPGTVMSVRGDLVLNSGNGDTSFHYCGFAGRLQEDATTSQLKRSLGWPKVVKRTQGYNQASLPVKGDPHFATLISSH